MSRTGYAKLSNEFWRSPSVMEMLDTNPAALGYYVAAVSYASDNLTDGLIEERVAKHSLHVPEDIIAFLVEIGKWETVEGGWLIHNYAKWQNSREHIEAQAEQARERVRRFREKQQENNASDNSNAGVTHYTNVTNAEETTVKRRTVNQNTKPKHNNQNDSSSDESNTPQTPHRDADAYTPEFEAFWQAYPRKKDKRAAWKAWKAALKRADPETIITAAKAEARRPCELKFRKYPASWLNADAWEDEPDQQAAANMQPPGLSREQANLAHNMGVVQYFRDHPEG